MKFATGFLIGAVTAVLLIFLLCGYVSVGSGFQPSGAVGGVFAHSLCCLRKVDGKLLYGNVQKRKIQGGFSLAENLYAREYAEPFQTEQGRSTELLYGGQPSGDFKPGKVGCPAGKMEENKRKRNIAQGDSMKYQNRYPLTGMLHCPFCGRTLRRRMGYKKKVEWLCATYIEEGKQACPGVRIPDESASRQHIIGPTVAEEVYRDGKKHYRYTGKEEFDRRRGADSPEEKVEGGGVLPGEYRPRRTAIKL